MHTKKTPFNTDQAHREATLFEKENYWHSRVIPDRIVEAAVMGNVKPFEVWMKLKQKEYIKVIITREHQKYIYINLGPLATPMVPKERWIIKGKIMISTWLYDWTRDQIRS